MPTRPPDAPTNNSLCGLTAGETAARLSEMGHVVTPLVPNGKQPWPPGLKSAGRSASTNELLKNPLSPSEVREIAGRWPTVPWGLLLDGSGLCVLDVDDAEGLQAALGRPLPEGGPTVSRGDRRHLYFGVESDHGLRRRTLFKLPDGHQVGEFKVAGLVVLPGSRHKSGDRYVWAPRLVWGEVPLPPLPDWLRETVSNRVSVNRDKPGQVVRESVQTVQETVRQAREEFSRPTDPIDIPTTPRESGPTPPEPRATDTKKTESMPIRHTLAPSLSPGFLLVSGTMSWDVTKEQVIRTTEASEEFCYRLMVWAWEKRGRKGHWPGVGSKFACFLEAAHANEERGSLSAAVFWDKETGRLRYHCHLGHSGSHAWSLVHLYAYLVTDDPTVLAQRKEITGTGIVTGGLGTGEVKSWAARALFDTGMVRRAGFQGLRTPQCKSRVVLRVWEGFVLLLECQLLYDEPSNFVYEAVCTRNFIARWSGVSRESADKALLELQRLGFLRQSGKVGKATVYVVGSAAFDYPHQIPPQRGLP